MSLTDLIYAGSNAVAGLTEGAVNDAIEKFGADHAVGYPDTAYCLPIIYAATGVKIKTLGDLPAAVGILKSLITNKEDLGEALNAGLATAVGAEIIEAIRYLDGDPYANDSGIGFVPDPIIRSLGVPLVTGDIPGIAVLLGEAADPAALAAIVKDYQEKGLLTFMVGNIIEQALEGGVKMGLDYRVIPLGHEVTSVIHVVSVAIRAALIFGGIEPGKLPEFLTYTKERVPAFVNTFGELNEVIVSVGAGAIALGFPVIADVPVPEVPGALMTQADHSKTVEFSLEAREIKIKVTKIDVPVSVASAFEGERVRKDTMFAEFGGNKTECWELVTTGDPATMEDHKITVIGPDIDDPSFADADVVRLPLGIVVTVGGKAMQKDFETVLERRIHYFTNYIDGAMHVGQRNIAWIRLTKEAFAKGFRLKHIGEVLYAKMRSDFEKVVDKCEITIYTNADDVKRLGEEMVKPIYAERDARMNALTDESVDEFYTCLLCQSFAPSHVCIVTPERLGLCGAVSWLDAKATKELDPEGPNQPVIKGTASDERVGRWDSVNKAVASASQGAVESVTLYSILEDPMTSCGCFECICGIMPEANGVIIVNREFSQTSPVGMTFGELASMTGGGVQTPGFMGHGRFLIGSKKFMSAEGGLQRIVWMPKELKDDVADRLNKAVVAMGGPENFADMVCDETIATDSEAVLEFLETKNHPALAMDPIM
ncbi:CO dehydrogenase/CO-methylating acetyl-CoA synthase complex subunit beta [Acetobacterium wieringae]|uniref:CO-methylating acetyl-CoA synthase n=1 Tax=Acetobacterium wieringae TaxID=52694 RepID=A0A5D0WKA3_9FIRM|nr:acetyl-CoA decarbonylase/synthase complex subunit alpha/beta [Acetobacterium wieringae]TYC84762.1 CO dehydrogenase/CO-methylating acetyl-CoA synthase complex subunit beta [Acetobacterium wieringae]UYO64128.1 CO dehydrogenase/CO-methylating acetyl-CoA synthase complex subunit beta [Acetobacterium wieringae]VUZ23553.1 Carbon monoxide dehydrogenase/acetyl-CoA synthase subunit alpha [Acetobacterium wieringae]